MRCLAIVLAVLLTGCTAIPAKVMPPSELLEDCRVGKLDVSTSEGMADAVVKLAYGLKLCNLDKKALREWAN